MNSGTSFEFFRFLPSALTINVDYALGNSANIISLTSTNAGNGITLSNANATSSVLLTNTTANRTTNTPAVVLQTTSFTNAGINVAAAGIQGGFAPTAAGTSQYAGLVIAPTINQTGGHTGDTYSMKITPTLTAIGATHYQLYMNADNAAAWGVFQEGDNTRNHLSGALSVGLLIPVAKVHIKSTGATSATSALRTTDSAAVVHLDVADNGEVYISKDISLATDVNYASLKTNSTSALTITNTSGANINGTINSFKSDLTLAGANAFANVRGLNMRVFNTCTDASGDTSMIAVYGEANLTTASSRAASMLGGSFVSTSGSSTGGTIDEIIGVKSRTRVQTAGVTLTDMYGVYINDISNAATITNTYGLYIGDVTVGTQTNKAYSLYASDINARSFIGGQLGVGVAAPTAIVNIAAGTATANTGALKLTTGTHLTTPEQGSIEYDSKGLFFTPASNRYHLGMWGYVAKTAAYTLTDDDYTVDITANSNTYTLPTAVGRTGRVFIIMNSGVGAPVVDPAGAETIAGASTYTMAASRGIIIQSTGANWIVISAQ